MQAILPHDITYNITKRPDAEDVAANILSNRRLMYEAALLLENLYPGLKVEHVRVELIHASQNSPLREAFLAVIFMTYQEDFKKDIPKIIQDMSGVTMPEHYNTLISFLALAIAFYGVGAAINIVRNGVNSRLTNQKYNDLINKLSESMNIPEDKIRETLDKVCSGKRRPAIIRSAINLFRPAKKEKGGSIIIGGEVDINNETIQEVPDLAQVENAQPEERIEDIEGVEIRFQAQDKGRIKLGWAGIVPEIGEERIRMTIYPPLKAEELFLRPSVRGDIILVSRRQDDGSYKPHLFHLIRVHN